MASQERRKRRKRRRRRGRGGTLLLVMLCVALAAAGILAAITVFFKISTVQVSGETRYDAQELIDTSDIRAGGNMFFFNKFSAINRMFEKFPYLSEITIRRHLPDTVEITVSDCVPVAAVESEGKIYLIDEKGKVLEETASTPEGLCIVRGAALSDPKSGKSAVFAEQEKEKPLYFLLNTLREDGIIQQVGEVDFSRGYSVSFTYQDRFTVRIGTTEDLEKKMDYLRVIVTDKLSPNQRGVIDISDVRTARFISE